jgi:tRNA A-37 threonylcarbamoyl transferase component Bud32
MTLPAAPPAIPAVPRCPFCAAAVRPGANFCAVCGSRLTARGGAVLARGSRLHEGRYTIVRLLGQGGSGAVYLADDSRLGRQCVVKELLSTFASTAERRQAEADFQREALILARLSMEQGGLPQTYDFFNEGSRHYLVMQYIDGETLEDRLRRAGGPLPIDEVVRYGAAVAEILAHLHAQQPEPVIHRDVKPANIVVDSQGRVKLVDFGLAKALPSTTGALTAARHTTAAGTAGYTPLEQWMLGAEPRSDVYALGATIHQLLTGRDPRDAFAAGDDLNLDTLKRLGTFPPLRTLRPDVPPSLDTLVRRMLDETPADRPDALEVEQALIRVQATLTRRARLTADPPATAPVAAPLSAAGLTLHAFPPLPRPVLETEIAAWLHGALANMPPTEPVPVTSAQGDLVPVALVPYQVTARFETSTNVPIYALDEQGTLLLDGVTGKALDLPLGRFVAAHQDRLQPLDTVLVAAGPVPPARVPFKLPRRKIADSAVNQLIGIFSRTVSYSGRNGQRYTKQCKLLKKHITLAEPILTYVPRWVLAVDLRGRTYRLEAWQVGHQPATPPGATLYVLHTSLPGTAFCPGCGAVVAPAQLVACDRCGKQVCPRCAITRTRFGFFHKTYCSAECAR